MAVSPRKKLLTGLLVTIGIALFFGLAVVIVSVLNADLYGRLTEVVSAEGAFSPKSGDPTITVVLHRAVADENSIEASVILQLEKTKFDEFKKQGNRYLRASVFDASFQPYGIGQSVTIDLISPDEAPEPGRNVISRESARFMLPTSPSNSGFPFDDLSVRFSTILRGTNGVAYSHFIKVEKQLPGRILSISLAGGFPTAVLSRTGTEKFLTMTSAVIFVILTLLVAVKLFISPSLGNVASILTLAGFLIGTAGIRNVLGISRASGGSALEVFTFEVPFLILATAICVSSIRGVRSGKDSQVDALDV